MVIKWFPKRRSRIKNRDTAEFFRLKEANGSCRTTADAHENSTYQNILLNASGSAVYSLQPPQLETAMLRIEPNASAADVYGSSGIFSINLE